MTKFEAWHNEHEANISRRSDAHKSEIRAKKVYVPIVKKVEEVKVEEVKIEEAPVAEPVAEEVVAPEAPAAEVETPATDAPEATPEA
jgi:hypothetical protein